MSGAHIGGVHAHVSEEPLTWEVMLSATVEMARRVQATATDQQNEFHDRAARQVIDEVFLEHLADVDRDVVCRVAMWLVSSALGPQMVAGIAPHTALNVTVLAALRYGGHLPPP